MVWYADGSIQVAANGQVATGTGTAFLKNVRIGDGLTIAGSASMHEVTNIASDTQLTFAPPYSGAAGAGKQYRIAPIQGYVKEAADLLRALTQNLGSFANNANLTALAAAVGAANKGLMFTGPGAIGTFDLSAQGRTLLAAQTLAAQQAALGLVPTVSVQDTTVARLLKVGDFNIGRWETTAGYGNPQLGSRFIRVDGSGGNGPTNGITAGLSVSITDSICIELAGRSGNLYFQSYGESTPALNGWQVVWTNRNLVKQANPSDATPGYMLMNGAHGLGGYAIPRVTGADIDANRGAEIFRTAADSSSPYISYVVGLHAPLSTNDSIQIMGAVLSDRLFFRCRSGNNWRSVQEVWHTGNLTRQLALYSQRTGDVLENGSFGLGSYNRATNLNDTAYAVNGFTSTANSPTGYPNSGRGGVINLGYAEGERGQLILDPPTGNLFMRIRYSGTAGVWQSPVQFWHTGNLTPNKLEDRTQATLGTASSQKGQMFICTNTATRGQRPVYSDGTNWRRLEDDSLITAA